MELESERTVFPFSTLGNLLCLCLLCCFAVHALPNPAAHVAGLPQELQQSEHEPTAGQMRPTLGFSSHSHVSLKELPHL